jgi:hypothetical protein
MGEVTALVLGGLAPRKAGYGYDISRRAIEQLHGEGHRLVMTDRSENIKAASELAGLADEVHALDFGVPEACVAWAVEYAQHSRVDAVLGFREYAVQSVAEVAAALGLKGNPPQVVRTVRSKDACREHLRSAGLHQPELRLCATLAEAEAALREFGRAIVKPRDRSNSQGVTLVEASEHLPAALRHAQLDAEQVIVEQVVVGAEVSIEGILLQSEPHILCVTEKRLAQTGFREIGHTLPASLAAPTERALREAVVYALTALGATTGPFHVEAWLTEDGVVIGEVHLRQGGDWIHAALEWCHPGLRLYSMWLEDLLGAPRRPTPRPTRGAAIRFVVPDGGTVTRIVGWDEIAEHPSVLHSSLDLEPGQVIPPVGSNDDRFGVVLVGTERPHDAGPLADRLLRQLNVELLPEA